MNNTNTYTMKHLSYTFTEGQKINTIKYTDNKDITKARAISRVGFDTVQFEGLQGWWKYYTNKYESGFYKGDNYLTIIK
tara:strand:+ start:65 stop:301 length:237 start_codon:yes stop_codon:yes gene_type:complete